MFRASSSSTSRWLPLSRSDSAVLGSGLSDYRQFLVVNYEYTPTLGEVDGYSYGGRAEAWVLDAVRLGVTGFSETTGRGGPVAGRGGRNLAFLRTLLFSVRMGTKRGRHICVCCFHRWRHHLQSGVR